MTDTRSALAHRVQHTVSVTSVRSSGEIAHLDEVRILLGLDQALFRESVRAVFEQEPDLTVIVEVESCMAVTEESARVRPGVVVLDSGLGGGNVVETVRALRAQPDPPAVLCLGRPGDLRFLEQALRAGSHGFVTRGSPVSELVRTVRAVDRGEMVIPPAMLAGVVERLLGTDEIREDAIKRISRLTQRERHVLAFLSRGATNTSVASALFISPLTARTHIQNVLRKLGVHSRLEAAMFVAQNDILHELERGSL